jgi:hypothetical protein
MSPSSTKALAIGFLALAFCLPVRADDSAVSVAVGGIRLSKEAHISMEKERLSIGLHKITVDFDFLNETDKDITIEVGFPVPPYEWYAWEPGLRRDFADFHVWVDGSAIQYKKDVRGKVKGRDYTDLILASHLPLDFAENNPDDSTTDSSAAPAPAPRDPVLDLSPADRSKLLNLGLIKAICRENLSLDAAISRSQNPPYPSRVRARIWLRAGRSGKTSAGTQGFVY